MENIGKYDNSIQSVTIFAIFTSQSWLKNLCETTIWGAKKPQGLDGLLQGLQPLEACEKNVNVI